MGIEDFVNTCYIGGKIHGAHVCTKCGWNYPNPHPSAKNRRSHKKICGTIKGYELSDSIKEKHNLDLQEEHCLDTEQETPSPRVVKKSDEKIGDVSEEDVFADAVCEFSCGLVSDSFKEKEKTATNCEAKSAKHPGEIKQCNSSPTGGVAKSSEVPPVEVLENYDVPSSVEGDSDNPKCGNGSTEGRYMAYETPKGSSSEEAKVVDGFDAISEVGFETEYKGNLHTTQINKSNLPDESESKLAPALEKTEDSLDAMWNDEVIYSDLEGPHGFTSEAMSMTHPGEAESIASENVLIDASPVKAYAAQVMSTSQSVPDDKPCVESADVSLNGTKGLEEIESSHSVNPSLHKTHKGDKCETDTLNQAGSLGIQREGLSIGTKVPSLDKLQYEENTEPQRQTDSVAIKEFPSTENIVISKIEPEDIKTKAEEGESSSGAAQETVELETLGVSLPAVVAIVPDSAADLCHAANKTSEVDLTGQSHESELIQEDVVTEENIPNSKLSSESSCDVERYVSPVSVLLEGDETGDQRNCSTETSKDSILQIGSEACKRNDEARRESSKGGLVEENSFTDVTSTKDDPIIHSESTVTAPDDTINTANLKSLESGRTGYNRVVGGLGVIQGNEIDGYVKEHNIYAEVPVTIESSDHRDFGRLQNLSEAHIRSLVSSPLVTRNNTFNAFESNLGSVSGLSDGVNKRENTSESSSLAVALSKSQEITLEKTTSWSRVKEQHVPLKNLLSEARSPRLQQEAKTHQESNIPRVSSILGEEETSPEDARWPERREVSEEWNSPAKYPVDLKREERKVKGRPFWVPFVCCSSVK